MNTFIILFFILVGIYCCVSWLLPRILASHFKRKYRIRLRIGRIAVPKLIFKDVSLSRNGYSVHIDEISFCSSLFNSEANKLLSVNIKDVRINNNVEEKRSIVVETILKPLLSKQNSINSQIENDNDPITFAKNLNDNLSNLKTTKLLDFRNKKLPQSLMMFAQFTGVHVYNVSVMVLHGSGTGDADGAGWLLHGNVAEIHVDGAAGGATRTLAFAASLVDATAKLLPRDDKLCLGELSCGLQFEGIVTTSDLLSVEKILAVVNNLTVSVHEAFYSFVRAHKSVKKPASPIDFDDEDHMPTLIPRLSPIIPKILSLKIDSTTLSGVDNSTRTDFQASLQSLQINSRFSAVTIAKSEPVKPPGIANLPQVYVAFQMDQLKLNNSKEKLLFLDKLKLDAKLEKGVLNLYLIISTLSLMYNHDDVYNWYYTNIQKVKKSQALQLIVKKKKPVPPWVQRLFSSCVMQGCAELRALTVHARLKDTTLGLGCGGLKMKLDQLLDTRGQAYNSTLPRFLLGHRHWSTELLVDSGWVAAGGDVLTRQDPPPKKHHVWGHTLLLGVALVKWGSHGPRDSKIEAMMDCIRFEWSKTVATAVKTAIECIKDYKSDNISREELNEKKSNSKYNVYINIALSHMNFFLINEPVCLMTRIDAISLDRHSSKSSAVVSGFKIVEVGQRNGVYPCQRSDEVDRSFLHIKLSRIDYVPSSKNNLALVDIQLLESSKLEYCANMHLKILTLIRAIKAFRSELVTDDTEKTDANQKTGNKIDWHINFKVDTSVKLILSAANNVILTTDYLHISFEHKAGLSIAWSNLKMILNGDEVITADGFSMERVVDDSAVRVERIANEAFALDWNKTWGVNFESIRVMFPYKHAFAETIQGDFVSLFKWLKVIHNIKKKSFTVESPLPSDLHIKIEELLIEMSDDPFEVKLRDNHELLEDEYHESQTRRTMLDAKVQEYCKPHLFLPAGKFEELYAALRQKDAQIYVQRCRATPPPRTRLVACALTNVCIIALADPSIHGTQNATGVMRDIDFDSPWPEDGIEFTTLWCRAISASCTQWQLLLRDFPQPLLSMKDLKLWGMLVGAEEQAPSRAFRTVAIDQGTPWGIFNLERSMMPLKFYYDLCCEMDTFSYAFGPCWEPVIAQCNLSFDQVSRPSLDPSIPLTWWDKVRLLMHGRLTAKFNRFTCLLHVSLDPYNTTEEMELTWLDLALDWTNAKLVFRGELNVYVRTASKYDDCRLLNLPSLRLAIKLVWQCVGDPRDHHAVAPCAPDRLPEYSSNQEHDSYRAFRSQGLDVHLSLDTKPSEKFGPVLLLYGSTLRWFESLKMILSGVTRPTKRGNVFCNVRPRRPQLSRHYRSVDVSLTLHNLQIFYWSSSSKQRGIEVLGLRVTCGSKHSLMLVPFNDGLIRRPRAAWNTVYMNCDLNDAEIWLKSAVTASTPLAPPPAAITDGKEKDNESGSVNLNSPIEKCYCLSVRRVSYGRETGNGTGGGGAPAPTHRLAVHDLRGAWTKINRDVAFALLDTYFKTQQLKKNLSTKALKEEEKSTSSPKHQRETDMVSPTPAAGFQGGGSTRCAEGMLAQLVAEAGGDPPVVFSDDLSGGDGDAAPERDRGTHPPPKFWLDDDNCHTTWLIELVNSQVLLKGCETRGYVILCAARASVRQRVRRVPAAAGWSGALSAMQYYATVSAGDPDQPDGKIQWVYIEDIEERWSAHEISTLPDVPRLVGSGHSAGGVIGSTVGPSSDKSLTQLQRIVSRCACEFYYVTHDEAEGGPGLGGATAGWAQQPEPYDTFTLMHHDLDVCTNSLQYAMLLDVVNNLVLHVEPERRRTLERRARMRFQLQLRQDEDHRKLIQELQTKVRESLVRLRRLEKEYYNKRKALADNEATGIKDLKTLDIQVDKCKDEVWSLGEELDAMVRAWREVCARGTAPPVSSSPHAPPHRLNEICFKSARWRLTDADGQLGIADLALTNFLYTKTSRTDESVEHLLELGYVRVTNLLPNEPFPEVLAPQAPSGRAPLARRATLRVFCRDRPPVGGIAVKEHFEVNIVPIRIGLTKKFFNTMLKFCFPERDPDTIEGLDGDGDPEEGGTLRPSSKKSKKKNKESNSNFYTKVYKENKDNKDDVEKMKERAEKNKLFIYIKIPEVPVRLSYKGSKQKNLEDVRELPLLLPTLEYHNVTWTWLDLLLATKSDTRRVLLSQAIRQRLQLHRRAAAPPEPHEEDKARLLLGDRTVADNKPQKKNAPSVFKLSKS